MKQIYCDLSRAAADFFTINNNNIKNGKWNIIDMEFQV